MFGDSLTFGSAVHNADTMTAIVREKFPNSLNMGWPSQGWGGVLSYLGIYREYVKRVNPELIIHLHFENDFLDTKSEFEHNIIKNYLDDEFLQGLGNLPFKYSTERDRQFNLAVDEYVLDFQNTQYERVKNFILWNLFLGKTKLAIKKLVSWDFADTSYAPYDPSYDPSVRTDSNAWEVATHKMVNAITEAGQKYLFVYLPSYEECISKKKKSDHRFVIDFMKIKGATIADATDVICDSIEAKFDAYKAHYSPSGYSSVGRLILDTIEKENLLSPNGKLK